MSESTSYENKSQKEHNNQIMMRIWVNRTEETTYEFPNIIMKNVMKARKRTHRSSQT